MNRIVPCLWFDNAAEEAARRYTSIFPNATIGRFMRYSEEGHEIHGRPAGSVMTVEFELDGYTLLGLNGGPLFHLTPAISLLRHVRDRGRNRRRLGRARRRRHGADAARRL
jgi:predicted 3-demethylubiquinone-9 3-methyltransferase (glyoxalase superfamily)